VTEATTGQLVVGMVGGGQLARMTHQAAISLGLSLRVLATSPTDSGALVVPAAEIGSHLSLDDLLAFAAGCDVLTFDHEHVPREHLRALEAKGVVLRPGADALRYAQDKLAMRERLTGLGLPVPGWRPGPFGDLPRPVVLKAVRGGYDGRGVWVLEGPEEPMPAGLELYAEELVPLARELAVLVARRPSGEIRGWPIVETVQRDGICVEVVAPAPGLPAERRAEAQQIAGTIATELDVTGVLAVELFERSPDGALLVNELAMRPHNSGHWTIEGARTSQFEQHLRAVLDWPLGETAPTAPYVVMVNLLGGQDPDIAGRLPAVLAEDPGIRVHIYGKGARPGRKLGHMTALGDDLEETRSRARRAAAALRGPA
jgi:5-(carboxyamino)imidazole ribonucleotide synthase